MTIWKIPVESPVSLKSDGSGSKEAAYEVPVALALVVVLRHKSNISRLLRGEENRFEKKQDDLRDSE